MATTQKCLDHVGSFTVILAFVQSSNNKAVGIAQNHCSGNSITGNTASSNGEEGITADNQSNGGQVCTHQMICFSTNHLTSAALMYPLSPKLISMCN